MIGKYGNGRSCVAARSLTFCCLWIGRSRQSSSWWVKWEREARFVCPATDFLVFEDPVLTDSLVDEMMLQQHCTIKKEPENYEKIRVKSSWSQILHTSNTSVVSAGWLVYLQKMSVKTTRSRLRWSRYPQKSFSRPISKTGSCFRIELSHPRCSHC